MHWEPYRDSFVRIFSKHSLAHFVLFFANSLPSSAWLSLLWRRIRTIGKFNVTRRIADALCCQTAFCRLPCMRSRAPSIFQPMPARAAGCQKTSADEFSATMATGFWSQYLGSSNRILKYRPLRASESRLPGLVRLSWRAEGGRRSAL